MKTPHKYTEHINLAPVQPDDSLNHHMLMMSFSVLDGVAELFPIVVREDTCACNVVISTAMYIDKLEVVLHFCSHSFRIACQLIPNALLKRDTPPASHFLNVGVRKAREGQS